MDKKAYKRLKAKEKYGPLLNKDIRSVLKRELITNFGFENMGAIADLLIERFLGIIKEHKKPKEEMMPYQTIILAVDRNQRRGKGKTMAMTKLKPVVVNLMTREERLRLVNGEGVQDIRPDMVTRIMREVDGQGGTVAYNDLTILTGLTISGVAYCMKRYLKKHPEENIPHAGTVFDMGRTLTHKKQIIEEYLRCSLTKDIAEKCNHHHTNVDKYISDFNRVFDLYEEGKNEKQISFLTNLSVHLVEEYIKIIKEFTNKKKLVYSKRKKKK
jgi:hypothetical protein